MKCLNLTDAVVERLKKGPATERQIAIDLKADLFMVRGVVSNLRVQGKLGKMKGEETIYRILDTSTTNVVQMDRRRALGGRTGVITPTRYAKEFKPLPQRDLFSAMRLAMLVRK